MIANSNSSDILLWWYTGIKSSRKLFFKIIMTTTTVAVWRNDKRWPALLFKNGADHWLKKKCFPMPRTHTIHSARKYVSLSMIVFDQQCLFVKRNKMQISLWKEKKQRAYLGLTKYIAAGESQWESLVAPPLLYLYSQNSPQSRSQSQSFKHAT